jgi:hypothetical protein
MLGLLIGLQGWGQDSIINKSKIWISVSGGLSVPLNNFSNYEQQAYDGTINLEGGADIGWNVRAEGKYMVAKNVGFALSVFSSTNKTIDVPKEILFPPEHLPAMGGGYVYSTNNYNYNAGDWHLNGITGGIVLEAISGIAVLNFSVAGGIEQVQTPSVQIDRPDTYWWLSAQQKKSNNYGFVFEVGLSQGIMIKQRFVVNLKLNYQASNPQLNLDQIWTHKKGVESSKSISFFAPKGMFYLNLGFAYLLK